MDLLRRDLLDAYNDAGCEDMPAFVAAEEQPHSTVRCVCTKCGSLPAPGDKLRYCGRCEVTTYCNKQCARAHWAEHKVMCEILREGHKRELAAHEARGGRKKDYNQASRDNAVWIFKIPGLINELQLLAWKHRTEAPFIHAQTVQSDTDGSGIRVDMIPRRIWEEDPRFNDKDHSGFRALLQQTFSDKSSFRADEQYVCWLTMLNDDEVEVSSCIIRNYNHTTIRGEEIVEALSAGTGAEDLTDTFTWIENAFPALATQTMLQTIRTRSTLMHGSTTMAASVSVPTRAINNEVACVILSGLELEVEVCLTGLRVAAHHNGREGIIRGLDPASNERWKVQLDDGTCVSAKAANLVHIRRGEYTRRSP